MKKEQQLVTNSQEVVQSQIMEFIIAIIQAYFNLPENYYCKKTRKREIVFPRQIVAYLTRKYTTIPLTQIGFIFNQDHATIIHAIRTVKSLMEFDKSVKETVNDIDKIIQFKSQSMSKEMNIEKDYYYVDLSNFTSLQLSKEKTIILAGFSEEETKGFLEIIKGVSEQKEHKNTGMYILEKRTENGE